MAYWPNTDNTDIGNKMQGMNLYHMTSWAIS